jgi:uncharacterized protein (TIGR03083 family)
VAGHDVGVTGERGVDRADVEDAVVAANARLAALVRSLTAADAATPVAATPGWTAADVAAHVLTVHRRALGDRRRSATPEETGELNQLCLDETPERDPVVLADLLERDGPACVEVLRSLPTDLSFRFHGGTRTTVVPVTGVILGEVLVHGHDIATAVGRPWAIAPAEAALVLAAMAPMHDDWVAPDGRDRLAAALRATPPVDLLLALHGRAAATPELAELATYARSF